MPTGKVKWFDSEKGFGFLTTDEGQEVFLHSSALPTGVTRVLPGTRMEFGIVDGRRGAQALSATVLAKTPSVARNTRKPPEDMAVLTEDLIRLLDEMSTGLHKGRYPDRAHGHKIASILRTVADELDV